MTFLLKLLKKYCCVPVFFGHPVYTESLRVIKKIRATFLPQNVDTTAISEWWLKPSIFSIDVSFVDYSIYKKHTKQNQKIDHSKVIHFMQLASKYDDTGHRALINESFS